MHTLLLPDFVIADGYVFRPGICTHVSYPQDNRSMKVDVMTIVASGTTVHVHKAMPMLLFLSLYVGVTSMGCILKYMYYSYIGTVDCA